MNIPRSVQQFITKAVVCGNMHLPFHYPALHESEGYQSGFRYHGITGEDLTSTAPGEWQPGWYVIALNGFDDPFFVDFTEEDKGFPVYYAPHGSGKWEAAQIAGSIEQMSILLLGLQAIPFDQHKTLLETGMYVSLDNPFWQEVYEDLEKKEREDNKEKNEILPVSGWISGQLVITGMGAEKIRVTSYLKKKMGLNPQQALALGNQPEIVVQEGYRQHLQPVIEYLSGLGATAVFRPHPVAAVEDITIEGHAARIMAIVALVDKLPIDSDYYRYFRNREDWLQSRAVYFTGDVTLDLLDLDNPFGRVSPDWQQRYAAANEAGDEAGKNSLWEEHDRLLIRLIIVDGNLVVNRHIINDETDGASGLIVLGNIKCNDVIVGGQEIFVQGNLQIPGLYWGNYNHGSLRVKGNFEAQVFIETDEYHVNIHGVQQTLHHWDNDAFVDERTAMQVLLHEDCFDDPQSSYPTEVLSRYAMQQRLKEALPLLKAGESSANRLFNDYNITLENLRILCSMKFIEEAYFRFKIEDVDVQLGREHTDNEGKTWLPTVRIKQDEHKVFACIISRQQEHTKRKSLLGKLFSKPAEPTYIDTLELMWQAPDNEWYYIDEQTPDTHRNLLAYFWPGILHRAEQMEHLAPHAIATCAKEISQAITQEKMHWFLSRPIITRLYNDYYSSSRNGYWCGSVYFAFRHNHNTCCDRIQLVKHRNSNELKYYPSVKDDTDACGYRYDLETNASGDKIVVIEYQPHDAGSSYSLTPLDVDHYQKALALWQYFEAHFIRHNALFEAGRWEDDQGNEEGFDMVAYLEKNKPQLITLLGAEAYEKALREAAC